MKIPEYEQQVAPRAAEMPSHQVVQRTGYDSVERAGAEVGQAVDEGVQSYEKIQHQMAVKASADALAAFSQHVTDTFYGTNGSSSTQNLTTGQQSGQPVNGPIGDDAQTVGITVPELAAQMGRESQPGYLSTRGESAVPALTPTVNSIAKKRADLAAGLSDPKARSMFLQASVPMMDQSYHQAHAHAAEQIEVSKTDSVKALLASGLRATSADPLDDNIANINVGHTVGAAVALATSPADAKAQEEAIQARFASSRIDALIAPDENGKVPKLLADKAQKILEQNRPVLGEQLRQLETRIAQASKGADKQELEDAAEGVAQGVVGEAIDPLTGRVDENKVWKTVDQVKSRAEKEEVQKRVRARITEQTAVYTQNTKSLLAQGMAAYNAGNSVANMPAALKQKLNDWPDPAGPDLLNRLHQQDLANGRAAKTSRSTALKDQAALIRDAQNDFKALPIEEQATMDLSPTGEFAQNHPALTQSMQGLPNGLKTLLPIQRLANDHVTKGQSATVNRVIADTVGALSGGEGAYISPGTNPEERAEHARRLAEVKAQTLDAYNQFVEDHGGKAPSKEEAAKLSSQIILSQPVDPTSPEQLRTNANAASVRVGGARTNGRTPIQPKQWTREDIAGATRVLTKRGKRITQENIDQLLQTVHGLPSLPVVQPSNEPPPTDGEVTDDYGLDLNDGTPSGAAAVSAGDLP